MKNYCFWCVKFLWLFSTDSCEKKKEVCCLNCVSKHSSCFKIVTLSFTSCYFETDSDINATTWYSWFQSAAISSTSSSSRIKRKHWFRNDNAFLTQEVWSNEEDSKKKEIDTSIKNSTENDDFYVAENALDQSSFIWNN